MEVVSSSHLRPARVLACLLTAATLTLAPATANAQDPAGQVRVVLNATSAFDHYLTGSSPEQQQWMRDHYWRMRGYAPYFTSSALEWAPPSVFYRDLLAIYSQGDEQLLQEHPEWVLKNSSRNNLYVDFACSGGSCPQYVADIGNPEFRQWWIDQARADLEQGYTGIFVDDVNMEMTVSDGNGDFVRPVDPRTGQPMTDENWRRYVAEFTEQIRTAFPNAEITHNALWRADKGDPYVQRQMSAADSIELERGFNDQGIGGGTGRFGYQTYLAHIDWLHARGKGVTYEPGNLDPASTMFELASYFLVDEGRDAIATDYRSSPDNWWQGWETDLGAPLGNRYSWQGLLRRDFSGGVALVNEPDNPARSVALPSGRRWTNLEGMPVTSVTLGDRRGAVLYGTPDNAPAEEVTLRSNRKRVRSGRKLRLSGRAPAAGAVSVQTLRHGKWRAIARDLSVADGRYRVGVRARPRGIQRYRAEAAGLNRSRVLRVKVSHR